MSLAFLFVLFLCLKFVRKFQLIKCRLSARLLGSRGSYKIEIRSFQEKTDKVLIIFLRKILIKNSSLVNSGPEFQILMWRQPTWSWPFFIIFSYWMFFYTVSAIKAFDHSRSFRYDLASIFNQTFAKQQFIEF